MLSPVRLPLLVDLIQELLELLRASELRAADALHPGVCLRHRLPRVVQVAWRVLVLPALDRAGRLRPLDDRVAVAAVAVEHDVNRLPVHEVAGVLPVVGECSALDDRVVCVAEEIVSALSHVPPPSLAALPSGSPPPECLSGTSQLGRR